ncbi:MAG: polysaccharide deacetylase family protein, partial [Candidatus Sulfotelmatobacter sp.]
VGGAILTSVGARGTYYAAPGLMETKNELGDQFTRRDLESLLADGHELGSHTFNHISCRSAKLSTFEGDVKRGRAALIEIAGRDPVNFAYPFGHVTVAAKNKLGMQMKSCRGIYPGWNGRVSDLNLLRANSLYGDADGLSEVEALLADSTQGRGWLIFYTHDVRPSPTQFGCTPELLEKTVCATLERGFRIMPVEEVLACDQAVCNSLAGGRSKV